LPILWRKTMQIVPVAQKKARQLAGLLLLCFLSGNVWAKDLDIRDFGASADGVTLCSAAFQKTIRARETLENLAKNPGLKSPWALFGEI
ncbi:MAG: glycoside hydrolase family 55 protein, partial [Bacteroidetes bacterium]|nr:glycoside hydrolase family 55 protein [Bacteroidota bacterium]